MTVVIPLRTDARAPAGSSPTPLPFPAPVIQFLGMAGTATAASPVPDAARPVADRPALRVIPGGREAALRRRRPARVYRRRRLTALVVVLVAVLGVAASARAGVGDPAADPLERSVPAVPAVDAVPVGASVVVQPGDTLWSIAAALDLGGDVRVTVQRLADANGGSGIEAGQRIDLRPVLGG